MARKLKTWDEDEHKAKIAQPTSSWPVETVEQEAIDPSRWQIKRQIERERLIEREREEMQRRIREQSQQDQAQQDQAIDAFYQQVERERLTGATTYVETHTGAVIATTTGQTATLGDWQTVTDAKGEIYLQKGAAPKDSLKDSLTKALERAQESDAVIRIQIEANGPVIIGVEGDAYQVHEVTWEQLETGGDSVMFLAIAKVEKALATHGRLNQLLAKA